MPFLSIVILVTLLFVFFRIVTISHPKNHTSSKDSTSIPSFKLIKICLELKTSTVNPIKAMGTNTDISHPNPLMNEVRTWECLDVISGKLFLVNVIFKLCTCAMW